MAERRQPLPLGPRAMFYCHDAYGLGHVRRVVSLTTAVARHRPDASMLVLTGSGRVAECNPPPNLDYVKLPDVGKVSVYRGLVGESTGDKPRRDHGHRGLARVRGALIEAAAESFAPHLFLVEDAPSGLGGETVNALLCLRAAQPAVHLVMALKDIYLDAARTRALWRRSGDFHLLDEVFDHILVFSDPRVYDPVHEYRFSAAARRKVIYCGYYHRQERLLPADEIRARHNLESEQPLVVVTVGGGGDGGEIVRTYVEAASRSELADVASFVVTGALASEGDRARLEQSAKRIPSMTLTSYASDLMSYVNAADAIVTMGGSSLGDMVAMRKKTLVIPRTKPWPEQLIRAETFVAHGLVSMLLPEALSVESLAGTLRELLDGPPPPPHAIDFGGEERAAAAISDWLPREVAPSSR